MSLSFPLSHFVKFWIEQSQHIEGKDFSTRPTEGEVVKYLGSMNPGITTFDDCQRWVSCVASCLVCSNAQKSHQHALQIALFCFIPLLTTIAVESYRQRGCC
jgi:hypothetical protein